jgi:hypoxanthine phosphoribosyltransferase
MRGAAASPSPVSNPTSTKGWAAKRSPTFAHASEAEFARILDFYQVRWEYEPHVFPILWTFDGSVAESFSPDFYLPDFDTYLELTTLRQPLVRKKNRKLRRLRELYPDVRIKLLYARDFRALMLKYGKFGLVDALSGTSGQVLPPQPAMADSLDAAEVETVFADEPVLTDVAPLARPTRRRRRRAVTAPATAVRVAEA